MTVRTKTFSQHVDFKALSDDGEFEGFGSVFGNIDLDRDIVAPGAFDESLKKRPVDRVKLLWMHRHFEPIGKWNDIAVEDGGLRVRGKLTLEVQRAREVYALMKDNAVDGLSIGYRTVVDEYDQQTRVTTLKELELFEVSVVPVPANEEARISVVKSLDGIATLRDAETALRDVAGFSQSEATKFVSHIKRIAQGDPDDAVETAISRMKSLTRKLTA